MIFPHFEKIQRFETEAHDITLHLSETPINDLRSLHTVGLSAKGQVVSEGKEHFSKIELQFVISKYCDLAKNQWLTYWLGKIARIPQKYNTWLGPGDTIPAGSPPERMSSQFIANHFIMSEPIVLTNELNDQRNNPSNVSVLSVIPVFQAELDFKLRNSGTALLRRLRANRVTDEVDFFRKSVCRKRILGF